MNARRWIWLAALPVLAGWLKAEDTEVWWTTRQRHAWDPRDTLEVFEMAKFRDNGSQLSEYFVEGGPVFGAKDGWQVAPWVHFGEVISGHDWGYEFEPSLNVLRQWRGRWLALATRGRLEYHERGDARNGWKLRGRAVLAPGEGWKTKAKPYVSEEVFEDFRVHRVDQNRLFLGTQFPLGRRWDGDVYFGWRSDLSASRWTSRRIVGVRAGWTY